MHTRTFWHLSEGKWGFYSKIIHRIHVIFLFKAAKLKRPMSTKCTHLLFGIFQKESEDFIKKIIYHIHVIFLFKAAKLKRLISTKCTHTYFLTSFRRQMTFLYQNYLSYSCDIFDQSREAKTANEHKIHTPTFWYLSEEK